VKKQSFIPNYFRSEVGVVRAMAAWPGFVSQHGEIVLFSTQSSQFSPSLLCNGFLGEGGAISPAVKRPGLDANHSLPSSAEVKNSGAISPLPHLSS
jgi:hypothetical protein